MSNSQSDFHGDFNLICPYCHFRNKIEEKNINFNVICSKCDEIIYHQESKSFFAPATQTTQHDDYGE